MYCVLRIKEQMKYKSESNIREYTCEIKINKAILLISLQVTIITFFSNPCEGKDQDQI
jgi:hypothetical protein